MFYETGARSIESIFYSRQNKKLLITIFKKSEKADGMVSLVLIHFISFHFISRSTEECINNKEYKHIKCNNNYTNNRKETINLVQFISVFIFHSQ